MYVIKMKTIIAYIAIFILCIVSIGIIRYFDEPEENISASAVSESSEDMQETITLKKEKEDAVDVPILMYHSIFRHSSKNGKYIVSEAGFEEDLKYITENGYTTIVMQDLIDYVHKDKTLPEKPVVLTFDDGYFNNYAYAYPLLKKYKAKAVLSIIGYYTDLYSETPDENPSYSHVTWKNVSEMIKSGCVEVQNHSYNLHTTDKGRNGSKKRKGESIDEYKKLLNEDLGKLQVKIKENTGFTPTTYTYPFGSVSNDSFDIIKDMGFSASLSCESGMNHISKDSESLYMLKRYLRTPSKSAEDILD